MSVEFQSTHSRRVRQSTNHLGSHTRQFQSTHSRRVRPTANYTSGTNIGFQSTHSRRVRHVSVSIFACAMEVSIHALTKSATKLVMYSSSVSPCFNPRTHEECDLLVVGEFKGIESFNPRTHEECDCIYFLSLISRYLEQCFRESS